MKFLKDCFSHPTLVQDVTVMQRFTYGAQHLVTATFGQRPKWWPKNFLVTDVPETAGASSDTSVNFSLGVE